MLNLSLFMYSIWWARWIFPLWAFGSRFVGNAFLILSFIVEVVSPYISSFILEFSSLNFVVRLVFWSASALIVRVRIILSWLSLHIVIFSVIISWFLLLSRSSGVFKLRFGGIVLIFLLLIFWFAFALFFFFLLPRFVLRAISFVVHLFFLSFLDWRWTGIRARKWTRNSFDNALGARTSGFRRWLFLFSTFASRNLRWALTQRAALSSSKFGLFLIP